MNTSPKATIEDKLEPSLYQSGNGWRLSDPNGGASLDLPPHFHKALAAIITTETTKARIDELEGMPHTTSIKPYVHERIAALQKEQNQ